MAMYIYKEAAQGSIIEPQSCNIFSSDMLLLIDNDVQFNKYDNTLICTGYNYGSVKENYYIM